MIHLTIWSTLSNPFVGSLLYFCGTQYLQKYVMFFYSMMQWIWNLYWLLYILGKWQKNVVWITTSDIVSLIVCILAYDDKNMVDVIKNCLERSEFNDTKHICVLKEQNSITANIFLLFQSPVQWRPPYFWVEFISIDLWSEGSQHPSQPPPPLLPTWQCCHGYKG